MPDQPKSSDDLESPMIFVPHGAPEPLDWMRSHPGWVKFPATFRPRAQSAENPSPSGSATGQAPLRPARRPFAAFPPGSRRPGEAAPPDTLPNPDVHGLARSLAVMGDPSRALHPVSSQDMTDRFRNWRSPDGILAEQAGASSISGYKSGADLAELIGRGLIALEPSPGDALAAMATTAGILLTPEAAVTIAATQVAMRIAEMQGKPHGGESAKILLEVIYELVVKNRTNEPLTLSTFLAEKFIGIVVDVFNNYISNIIK
jgi:hypothetical protein